MIILTDVERNKFAAYLEESAVSDDALSQQCTKIGESVMAKKLHAEALAEKIVAAKLRATESQTL